MNNIDKDIEILEKFIEETQEEYSETLVDGKVYRIENILLEFKPTKQLANSISNVLSELESHKGKIILSDEEYNRVIENAQKDIKKELETYKKIAEKLADKMIYLPINEDGIFYCTKEAVIDWARKEVENGK